MNNIFSNMSFCRVVSLVLTAVFLSSFPAGATSLAICVDSEENHIINQEHLRLDDCHPALETVQPSIIESHSVLKSQDNDDCVDILLSNSNLLIRSSERKITEFTKLIFPVVLFDNNFGFQDNLKGQKSSLPIQPQFPSPSIIAQRTVVLLI